MTSPSDWSVDRSVADMTDAGAFGPGCGFVSFALDDRRAGQEQFASVVLCGTVTVRDPDGHGRSHQLVIKLKHRLPQMAAMYTNDSQFHNEILFYERIKPLLMGCVPAPGCPPSLCRYFYGRNECGDRVLHDAIVLENECFRGYRVPGHRMLLDLDHLVVALRSLARFHGLSYRAKHMAPETFAGMMAEIKETHWKENGEYSLPFQVIETLISVALDRFEERRGGDDRLSRFRARISDGGTERMLRTVLEPREPLAVLCHGDFNLNNLLFRYDDRGAPVDAVLLDVADVRYVSPAFDLSFFLYMNADRATRDAHWDALLDAYCAELSESVAGAADAVRAPDRGRLDEEMRRFAFYALVRVSFFIRVMTAGHREQVELEALVSADVDAMTRLFVSLGGDRATDYVADVVQHIFDTGAAETLNEM